MPGKIFVNYRRDDARDMAARIRDRLAARFGDANVFMDVDNLRPGQRFDRELEKALAKTDVFLAVIGSRWHELLTERQASGDHDYVREEIAGALQRGILVIPVVIEQTRLPSHDTLPGDMRDVVLHQKHVVSHERFGRDVAELVEAIRFGRAEDARKRAEAYRKRGKSYSERRDYDSAIADYTKAIEIDPQYADAYYNRGSAYYDKGDKDRAIADYTKAIEIDPQHATAYCGRGHAYYHKGAKDGAIANYTKAIEIDPQYADAYYSRGNAYQALGRRADAVKDYRRALAIHPNHQSSRGALRKLGVSP